MTTATFSRDVVASIRAALLTFFDEDARDLPWRHTRDPYAIWISEVMAQQTRVETVIPYYRRWLDRFPDVHALADAPEDDVLKAWEGLGYYSRARNLHSAARVVRERHAGALPQDWDELRALPGVGDYTAGAIASIAFDAPHPAVDGNVRRVLSRLLDEPAPTAAGLRAAAAALVDPERPGAFNQALMELGARICTPRAPRCTRCPIAPHCAAFAAGTQLQRPVPKTRADLPVVELPTAVLRRPDDCVLLVRRSRGLLGGMWTFPFAGEPPAGAAQNTAALPTGSPADVVLGIAAAHGTPVSTPVHLGDVTHTFSHRRETYLCYEVRLEDTGEGMWVGADRSGVALPRAQQRVHALAFSDR